MSPSSARTIGTEFTMRLDVTTKNVVWPESAVAVGVRRGIAPLQTYLMHPQAAELVPVREEALVQGESAGSASILAIQLPTPSG